MIKAYGNVWRAELTVGTMQGYDGPEVIRPQDMIKFIETFQRDHIREWFPTIVWSRGTVIGPTFKTETVIKISLESNPLYSPDASDTDVLNYAVDLAAYLGKELAQVRVYVALYQVACAIVEQP